MALRAEAADCGGRELGMGRGRGARRARAARWVGVGGAPLVVGLLALGRASRSRPARAALVRRALSLPAPEVLELYQISPFVLELHARSTPATSGGGLRGWGGEISAGSTRAGDARRRETRRRGRARPTRRETRRRQFRRSLVRRAPSRAVRTRDSWVARSSHRTIFARVGVGAGETRDARASVRARGTHLSTLKSGS